MGIDRCANLIGGGLSEMKKQVVLLLFLFVGVSIIGKDKTYAAEMRGETSIYFENTYLPESDVEEILPPESSKKQVVFNQNKKLPKMGEKELDKRMFSLGMILMCLATTYLLLKVSEWIFYKKKKIEEESLNMKVSKLALVGILSTSMLAGGAQISYAVDGGSVPTIGDVTFKEDTTITEPLDPSNPDPDKPITPEEPNGTNGPLSIDYVSQFHFGEQFISAKDETYNVKLDKLKDFQGNTVERPTFIQVTDNRGTNAGWKVQVQQGAQFSTKVGPTDVELEGAVISLENSTLVTTADNKAAAPTAAAGVVLVPGTSTTAGPLQDVVTAGTDKGMSTWINSFGTEATGEESVTLFVPGTSAKVKDGKYTTQLTWVLSDTPA